MALPPTVPPRFSKEPPVLSPLSYQLARAIVDDRIRDAAARAGSDRSASSSAPHRFQMPEVHEVDPPQPRRRSPQRELVIASLLRCDRDDSPTHRRRP
jgi:hypothetical protein